MTLPSSGIHSTEPVTLLTSRPLPHKTSPTPSSHPTFHQGSWTFPAGLPSGPRASALVEIPAWTHVLCLQPRPAATEPHPSVGSFPAPEMLRFHQPALSDLWASLHCFCKICYHCFSLFFSLKHPSDLCSQPILCFLLQDLMPSLPSFSQYLWSVALSPMFFPSVYSCAWASISYKIPHPLTPIS